MPPVPPITKVPEPRQTTLSFDRPRIALRPGKPAKSVEKAPTKLNRQRLPGSPYENHLARQFRTAPIAAVDSDKFDPEGIALHRNSYSRKLKLADI